MFPTLLLLIPCSGIYLVHSQKPCSLLKAHLGQFSTLPPNQTHTHTHTHRDTPHCAFPHLILVLFFFFFEQITLSAQWKTCSQYVSSMHPNYYKCNKNNNNKTV